MFDLEPSLTVSQLIEQLQRFPSDARILVQTWTDEVVTTDAKWNRDGISIRDDNWDELGFIEVSS